MLTLVSALERNVKLYGNEYAVVDKERNFTWEEHVKRVAKLSGALQNLGLCAGDTVSYTHLTLPTILRV